MIRKALLLSLLVLTGLGCSYVSHAQLASTEAINVTLTPDFPRPYQIVTVTPDSSVIDLSSSQVTFSVNGTVVQRGSGSESASVAVGGPNSVTTIKVTAVNNGQTYSKTVTVRPADVALVLEPNTTSHPFYEGGSLVGGESRLRIIAIPDLRTAGGVQIPASSLVYTWKNGDQVMQSSSGIGKSVLSATAPVRYRDTTITLTVSSQDQSVVAQASMRISPTDPTLRVYESDPLLGPRYETALPSSVSLTDTEATYRAVPYFFSTNPSLTWSVNGTATQAGQDITVRPSGNGQGTAQLGVSGSSGALGQTAEATMSVKFGGSSSGLFGL